MYIALVNVHTCIRVSVGVGNNFILGEPNIIYSDLRCMYERYE